MPSVFIVSLSLPFDTQNIMNSILRSLLVLSPTTGSGTQQWSIT
ncbi:hypothetical protein [Mucilaginibacter flavus]|nr:hypothetical protein [Mucilaginibacter flavus]